MKVWVRLAAAACVSATAAPVGAMDHSGRIGADVARQNTPGQNTPGQNAPGQNTPSQDSGGVTGGGDVTFVVSHVRDSLGHVRVDICTAHTFLKTECPYSGAAQAVEGVTTVIVANVAPGAYAAQIYHDRNDNHAVDRGAFGIPLEEIGFSRDAPVGLTGPKFSRAAFAHGQEDQRMEVRLRRFR